MEKRWRRKVLIENYCNTLAILTICVFLPLPHGELFSLSLSFFFFFFHSFDPKWRRVRRYQQCGGGLQVEQIYLILLFVALLPLYFSYLSLFCLTTTLNWKFISGARFGALSRSCFI